ncbi:hypothetical protein J5X84_13685 [Streptosporangiaceae bacterium NEAU-GS5]|nr:hypothetical protein [Streptosporangiaceae bacterium NEAU-GS5]
MRTGFGLASAGLLLLGVVGCSASEASSSPSTTPSAPTTTPVISIPPRQDIRVIVEPTRIVGGSSKNVHLRAFCPQPQTGTEYRATAHSSAFTGLVTLVPPSPSAAPTPIATPLVSVPEVRGTAILRADAKPGGYKVEIRCEATNDIGSASLRVLPAVATPTRTATSTSTSHPTGAIHAGGGGTAAGGPQDDSGLPTGVTVIALLAALGVGVGVARRRSS